MTSWSMALLVLQFSLPLARADTYPSRPVKMIVYGIGGGSDVLVRQISARLQTLWGQGIAVVNPVVSGKLNYDAEKT